MFALEFIEIQQNGQCLLSKSEMQCGQVTKSVCSLLGVCAVGSVSPCFEPIHFCPAEVDF